MDKHAKKTSLPHYPVLIVFTLFFVGLFALDLITPDRAYSEMENTTLSQRPALTQLSAKGLNSYFTAYTKYVKDQVFGRDQWISLQSMVETTLLQKEQNGGILLGREHMMFPRTFGLLSSEERTLPKNTSAVESLCQRYPGKVNVLLAPAASDIYPENVPVNAPLLDENTYLDQLSAAVQAAGGRFVDVRGTLTDHKGEYLYYRTDHHWTSHGAYIGYAEAGKAMKFSAYTADKFSVEHASDTFRGTLYSKTLDNSITPDTIDIYALADNEPKVSVNVYKSGAQPDGTYDSMYFREFLNVKDKYSTFLGQNVPRIDINSVLPENADNGSLLVIKDSYAHSLIPFLAKNYSHITVLDLRYINGDIKTLGVNIGDYKNVLFMYNVITFSQDTNVKKLNFIFK